MVIPAFIGAAAVLVSGSNTVTWPIYFETTGGDVLWTSPTTVDASATNYNINASVTTLAVDVSFGFLSVPDIDVSDQLPSLAFGGSVPGPCPVDGGSTTINQPPTIAFDVAVGLDVSGGGYLDLTDVELGTATVTIPFFGEQTVQIDRLKIGLNMAVTPDFTVPCPADLDGDGVVGVNDVLQILRVYGASGPDGDVNGDGVAGVDDLLAILNVFGSVCP